MPLSRAARLVVLYYSHILTTIPLPVAFLLAGLATPLAALSMVLFLAGFWTLIGGLLMVSEDTRKLRRPYFAVGAVLVLLSAMPLL